MTAADHPQVQALAALYSPPDPGNERAPTAGTVRGAEVADSDGLHVDHTARLRRLVPILALEARIALECARDLYLTGGIDVEDGKRLATAYERLKRIAEVVAAAEMEVRA